MMLPPLHTVLLGVGQEKRRGLDRCTMRKKALQYPKRKEMVRIKGGGFIYFFEVLVVLCLSAAPCDV